MPVKEFQTAVENAVEAIRKIKTTAYSHRRVMVVEMMGRTSGYLTLYGGFAAGADIILLPELEYNLEDVCNKVTEIMNSGKRFVIIATSEAAKEKGKEETIARIVKDSFEQKRYGGIAEKLASEIEQITGYEARPMVLGHIQRGGEPCTSDIILGARLGDYALNSCDNLNTIVIESGNARYDSRENCNAIINTIANTCKIFLIITTFKFILVN